MVAELADLAVDRAIEIAEGQELGGEVLGKDDEPGAVVLGGVDERRDLASEVLDGVDRTDEVLDGGDTERLDPVLPSRRGP